jgi:hypothetical protein
MTTNTQQQVDYYRFHPNCTDEYIRAALDPSAFVSASDLSVSYDPKLRYAYRILMDAARIATERLGMDCEEHISYQIRREA